LNPIYQKYYFKHSWWKILSMRYFHTNFS
jgi:hypothetical protein